LFQQARPEQSSSLIRFAFTLYASEPHFAS
jgi:hypothetical protein